MATRGSASSRLQRIEAQMQRALALLLPKVKDPRVGSVTVTLVRLNVDMSVAKIYFVPFASRLPPEQVQQGLESSAGFLRGELGRQLQLRHAPRLEFEFDTDLDRAQHLTSLIDTAVAGDQARQHAPRDDESQDP